MMFTHELIAKAEQLVNLYSRRNLKIVTAESCSGGLLAGLLTEIPGASAVFERGFVTYSNEAKIEMLSVPAKLITENGAVSAQVASAMAEGALKASKGDVALSITGIAGPDGGTEQKPVGLVYLGLACHTLPIQTFEKQFQNNGRLSIRLETLQTAVEILYQRVT